MKFEKYFRYVEKLESSYITGKKKKNLNGAHALENTLADLQNVKCQATTISPSNFTPTYIPKKMENTSNLYTKVHSTLFIIAEKYSLMNE